MNNRGKLWIIPNEEEFSQELFERNVKLGEYHSKYIQEFSDLYMLGLVFKEDDQNAPYEIAKFGHVVVKSDDEIPSIICYLPERVTDSQYNWFDKNVPMLSQYIEVSGNSLQVIDEDGACWKKLHSVDEIITESRKKNLLPKKGMGR